MYRDPVAVSMNSDSVNGHLREAQSLNPPSSAGRRVLAPVRRKKSSDTIRLAKIIIAGMSGVGKSAISVRFLTRRYIGEYDEFLETKEDQTIVVDHEHVIVELLDTCTRGPAQFIKEEHVLWAEGFMLVYDVTRLETFEAMADFKAHICTVKKSPSVPLVIVGNKVDLVHARQVPKQKAQALAAKFCCQLMEVSAAEDEGQILEAFHVLYREIRLMKQHSRTLFDRLFGHSKK